MRKSTDLTSASEHISQLHTSAQTWNQNPEQPNWLTRAQVNRVNCEEQEIHEARAITTSKEAMTPKPTNMAGQGNNRGDDNRPEFRYQNCQPIEVNLQRRFDTCSVGYKQALESGMSVPEEWIDPIPHPHSPTGYSDISSDDLDFSQLGGYGKKWKGKGKGKNKY